MVTIIPVLFVDDNREIANIFQFYLEETGHFTVHVCLDGQDALEYLDEHDIQAIISDYDMPQMDGLTLLRQIRKRYPCLPFIMLTGNDSKEVAIEALNSGADFYQNKTEDLEIQVIDLSHKIRILVEKAQAEAAIRRKDLILEVIARTAGQLLKGENFYAEMKSTLGELCHVTGARGAFIGDPCMTIGESSGERPSLITWWHARDLDGSINLPKRFAELVTGLERELRDKAYMFMNDDHPASSSKQILHDLNVSSALFLPVRGGDEKWGYLALFFREERDNLADPELYAYSMLAELAGAARYRAYMEEYFKNPVEKSLVGVFLIKNNRFLYVNPRFSAIFGYSRADIMKTKTLPQLLEPPYDDQINQIFADILSGWREHAHLEVRAIHRDGEHRYLELYITTIRYNDSICLIGNCLDITERKEAHNKIRAQEELIKQNMMASLHEKETLLREIHHRVKNNMQIIASLLRLTDLQSNIPEVHEVIRDCRNRIFSMASIHEKLYETENLTKIPLGEYIRDVGKRIILEFEMTYEQMTYDVIEDQAMYVDINTGIPIGLLINELITNSLKHAFRPTCHGAITVQIRNNGDFCEIIYHDNGRGLPDGFDPENQQTLGIELIRNLTIQIQGSVSFLSGEGMTCTVTFPLMKTTNSHECHNVTGDS